MMMMIATMHLFDAAAAAVVDDGMTTPPCRRKLFVSLVSAQQTILIHLSQLSWWGSYVVSVQASTRRLDRVSEK